MAYRTKIRVGHGQPGPSCSALFCNACKHRTSSIGDSVVMCYEIIMHKL